MTPNAFVAKQLEAERAAAGLTREELAERSGISKSTIRRFEVAERDPGVTQLEALCAALGLSLSELLRRAEERQQYDSRQARILRRRK